VTRMFLIGTVTAAALALSGTAFAQQPGQYGSSTEANAMLVKAMAAVKADKVKALAMFNNGEGGFKDRDLYPFCIDVSDGKMLANSNAKQLIGLDARTLKDSTGHNFGQEIYDAAKTAKDGEIVESKTFLFPRPGSDTTPQPKLAYIERVGDVYCGVGYYK
jgi:hypothetical protein